MKEPMLFHPIRECECCGRSARMYARRKSAAPAVMGISFTIYRPALNVKSQQKAAPRVSICEECFAVVMVEPKLFESAKAKRFLAAIRQSLSKCYSGLLLEDERAA